MFQCAGDVTITVRYELSRFVNELRCSISATVAGKATPVNLAQHTYFNLAGHAAGTVLDHLIKINGDHYTPVGPDLVPTGEIASVLGACPVITVLIEMVLLAGIALC